MYKEEAPTEFRKVSGSILQSRLKFHCNAILCKSGTVLYLGWKAELGNIVLWHFTTLSLRDVTQTLLASHGLQRYTSVRMG